MAEASGILGWWKTGAPQPTVRQGLQGRQGTEALQALGCGGRVQMWEGPW
jgi:hypothetical protein